LLLKGLDVADVRATPNYIGWKRRLEYGVSGKDDDGVNQILRNIQRRFESFHVSVVLTQGILKLERISKYFLRPLSVVLGTKDPSFHVLCFDNEDSEARHDDVVDLRCPAGRVQRDIVDRAICVGRQP
jgi:hypothetical protein